MTLSFDFPVTSGSYDESYYGEAYIFVSHLSANLEKLLASTHFGGTGCDWFFSIVFQGNHNVYVAGDTDSLDIPGHQRTKQQSRQDIVGDIIWGKLMEIPPILVTLDE